MGQPSDDLDNEAFPSKNNVDIHAPTNESTGPGTVDPLHDVARVIDHKAERALCRKFDLRLLPNLAFMCMHLPSFTTRKMADD
jgi:hypothetical protein